VADNADTRREGWVFKNFLEHKAPFCSVISGLQGLFSYYSITKEGFAAVYAEAIRGLSEGELFLMEKAQTLDINCEEYYNICAARRFRYSNRNGLRGAFYISKKEAAGTLIPLFDNSISHGYGLPDKGRHA
jgi:hypothetical protein